MQTKNQKRPAEILLVDDDEIDALLTQESLRKTRHPINLHHVSSGRECLDFLLKKDRHSLAPTPDLILLDYHMPEMNGAEVLTEIRKNPFLKALPVVAMSHSCSQSIILSMFRLGCMQFVIKSSEFNRLIEVMRAICEMYLSPFGLGSNDKSKSRKT